MIPDLLFILSYHRGKGNAISADTLLESMRSRGHELPHMKNLRDEIHKARQAGNLIASCQAGYFLPVSLNEAMESIHNQFIVPSRDQLRTARLLRQAARQQFGGQLRLNL